jgi:hypothetical protein
MQFFISIKFGYAYVNTHKLARPTRAYIKDVVEPMHAGRIDEYGSLIRGRGFDLLEPIVKLSLLERLRRIHRYYATQLVPNRCAE